MNIMTQKKQVFWLEAIVSAASINLDNVDVKFNSLTMYQDDEEDTIVLKDREVVIEKSRHSSGVKLNIFIINEGDQLKDRIDWLIDEEYYVQSIDLDVKSVSTGQKLEYSLSDVHYQLEREVEIELAPELKQSTEFILGRLTEGNFKLKDIIYETLESDEGLQLIINTIADIPIV